MSDNETNTYGIDGKNKSETCNNDKTCQHHVFKGCNEKEERCEGTPSKRAICEATNLAKMIIDMFPKEVIDYVNPVYYPALKLRGEEYYNQAKYIGILRYLTTWMVNTWCYG